MCGSTLDIKIMEKKKAKPHATRPGSETNDNTSFQESEISLNESTL